MSEFFRSIWTYRIVRWTLSVLFILAGSIKMADPEAFSVVIRDFGLVPNWSAMPVAVLLSFVEIVAAIGLLFEIRGSLTVISTMLVLFIVILAYGIWLGLDIDCGCFGPEDPEARAYHGLHTALSRDLLMAAGVVFLYWWRLITKADFSVISRGSAKK